MITDVSRLRLHLCTITASTPLRHVVGEAGKLRLRGLTMGHKSMRARPLRATLLPAPLLVVLGVRIRAFALIDRRHGMDRLARDHGIDRAARRAWALAATAPPAPRPRPVSSACGRSSPARSAASSCPRRYSSSRWRACLRLVPLAGAEPPVIAPARCRGRAYRRPKSIRRAEMPPSLIAVDHGAGDQIAGHRGGVEPVPAEAARQPAPGQARRSAACGARHCRACRTRRSRPRHRELRIGFARCRPEAGATSAADCAPMSSARRTTSGGRRRRCGSDCRRDRYRSPRRYRRSPRPGAGPSGASSST